MNNNPTEKCNHTSRGPNSTRRTYQQEAEVAAFEMIGKIVQDSCQIAGQKAFLSKYLLSFSSNKTINNMNEANNLFFNMQFKKNSDPKQEDEPKPLMVDSLLPISADIDADNEYKNNLSKLNTLGESTIKMKNKGKESRFESKDPEYIRLNLTEVSEEDGFTKELRKQGQQKLQKMEGQRKEKQKLERLRLEKEKQKGKKNGQQKYSYDYNGQVLEIKTENKKNLVASIVNGQTNGKTNIINGGVKVPNPTKLEGQNPSKRLSKKMEEMAAAMSARKKDEVAFSDMKSLAEQYKTTYGVKYTYQGKTYEEKKKVIPVKQLKKTLSERKLSKEEFRMVKRLNANNRQQFQQNLKKQVENEQRVAKSRSEARFTESKFRRTSQTIHINSDVLKAKLLEKVRLQEPKKQQSEPGTIVEELKLDSIDRFNMNYMVTGGNLPSNTSKQFYQRGAKNQLPKIAHTTMYSNTKPKGREKLKDAKDILREMRKKFEEKLRV